MALPIEMGRAEWEKLLTEFIQDNFVADGMCADVCVHDTDGHNPHAHIMVTVRPLDENGQWQYKTEKEYLCIRDGEEMGFTGAEFKQAQTEGWEKQYQYKVGRKKERSLRTRRLIQKGAILESVFPQAQHMELEALKAILEQRLGTKNANHEG